MATPFDSIIDEVVESIKNAFGDALVSVILYGSYARGDFDNDSDIDIMAIVNLPMDEIAKHNSEMDRVASRMSLESENCTTVCISLQDRATFDRYSTVLPFFSNVLSEGVLLYAA